MPSGCHSGAVASCTPKQRLGTRKGLTPAPAEIIAAEQLVQQAERLYPDLCDAEREALQNMIETCKMQIAQQDIAGLEHSTASLKEKLFRHGLV